MAEMTLEQLVAYVQERLRERANIARLWPESPQQCAALYEIRAALKGGSDGEALPNMQADR